jgi:hypothetical protein
MNYKGICSGCNENKTLYYAKGTEWQHCLRCHNKGYRKYHNIRFETLEEMLVRKAKEKMANPPPPVALPPPRVQTSRETSYQRVVRLAREQRKRDDDLEALRQAKRREMDYNVKNYQPRQEYGSRTPLK